jgi:putative SOS response-associated peptidase YedK
VEFQFENRRPDAAELLKGVPSCADDTDSLSTECWRLRTITRLTKTETLSERPAYRNAFLKRRCVVPAEAFYEWVGPKKERQPLNIARADGKLLFMAGLFNYWKPANSQGRPMLLPWSRLHQVNGWRGFTTECRSSFKTIILTLGLIRPFQTPSN